MEIKNKTNETKITLNYYSNYAKNNKKLREKI